MTDAAAVQTFIRKREAVTVNGAANHVHLRVAIPPRIALATLAEQFKGVASAKANKAGLISAPLYRQEKYGAFSFDQKRLPNFIAYVDRLDTHRPRRASR